MASYLLTMRINIKAFVMNVEKALHTLTSGQIASISIENVFIELQPRRTRFQPVKPRVVVTFSIFHKVIASKMISVGLFLHDS